MTWYEQGPNKKKIQRDILRASAVVPKHFQTTLTIEVLQAQHKLLTCIGTTWANLAEHKWSAKQILGITGLVLRWVFQNRFFWP